MEYIFEDIEVCECIGCFEDEYVYDIEMDDETHTFIANDILVHNSSYVNLGPVVDCIPGLREKGDKEICHFLVGFADEYLNKYFDKILTDYLTPRHAKNYHVFELETVGKSSIFTGVKKRYAQAILWKDGRIYDEPKLKYKGLEVIKGSYPSFSRKILKSLTEMLLLDESNNDKFIFKLNQKMMAYKDEFFKQPIDNISETIKVNSYWDKVENDKDPAGLVMKKGSSFNHKALALYNWLINTKKLPGENIYSGKVKCYLLKKNSSKNSDAYFAYRAGAYPQWADTYAKIDKNAMFQKTVLEPINRILVPIGFKELHIDGSIEMDLFSMFD